MKILIRQIQLIDPYSGVSQIADLLAENGKIQQVAPALPAALRGDLEISGKDRVLFPGLIDLHTHLREPGFEHKEEIATGTLAALHGGFTTITAFPNTRPVTDSVERLEQLKNLLHHKAHCRVLPVAAVTQGLSGEILTPIAELAKAGAAAFTDDGKGVQNLQAALNAMKLIRATGLPFLIHAETEELLENGVIHRGKVSEKLGIAGIPPEAEEMMTARDLILAKLSGARIHFCHVSTAFAARMIALAKEEGVRVTAEATPHHLCLDEEMIQSTKDVNYKMNPPLRSAADREALVHYLEKGVIDAIATDHAPHAFEEKALGMEKAPFGITGLETALPLLYHFLVKTQKVSLTRVIEALTLQPSRILGLETAPIQAEKTANFVIFNTRKESFLEPEFFYSRSRNFPLLSGKISGKVEWVALENRFYDFTQPQFGEMNF